MERKPIIPTVSSCSGFRIGSSVTAYLKKLTKLYDTDTAHKLISNGTKTNPVLFEFVMGWPLNWTSLKPLKRFIIPKWTKRNLLKIKPLKSTKYQKERVKAIGNGQVPLCVYALLNLWLLKR